MGCLFFLVWGVALISPVIIASDTHWSLQKAISGFSELLPLAVFFPAGLAYPLKSIFPKATPGVLPLILGWLIYFVHGCLVLFVEKRSTLQALMIVLLLLLLVNVYGCSCILKDLSHIH